MPRIDPPALETLIAVLDRNGITGPVGIAVSGGSDSTALLVLTVQALGPGRVHAATVDHGLRPEAAAEAQAVAALCTRLGVTHHILAWDGGTAARSVMDAARRARLRLLSGWARTSGLTTVALGHTLDDQAETLLLRLARGSGVDGLSGMAEARSADGIVWLRPFLAVSRAALRAELRNRGFGWTEDPTNADPRFARSRARLALDHLQHLGITARGLAETAGRMARARAALEGQERAARARLARDDRGTVLLERAVLTLPPEIRDRVFAGLLIALSGADYRPRLASLHRALAQLAHPGGVALLAGVCLRAEGPVIRLWREHAAIADDRSPATEPWDRRWHATGPAETGASIAALGSGGLTRLSRQAAAGLHPHWRQSGLDAAVLKSLPAIWSGDTLIAAPLALWPQGWTLSARPLAAHPAALGESD